MANSAITKRAIAASFRRQLESTPFEKITVSGIAADCGINRQTFYYHFHDIYDLIDWIILEEVAAIIESNGGNWKRSLVDLLESVRADRSLVLRLARSSDPAITYRRLLKSSISSLLQEKIASYCTSYGLTAEEGLLAADFYAAGLLEVSLTWLEDEREEDAEALVRRLETVMASGVTEMLAKSPLIG